VACVSQGGSCESGTCCEGLTCFYDSFSGTYTCIL
jgi:hypothetical protein